MMEAHLVEDSDDDNEDSDGELNDEDDDNEDSDAETIRSVEEKDDDNSEDSDAETIRSYDDNNEDSDADNSEDSDAETIRSYDDNNEDSDAETILSVEEKDDDNNEDSDAETIRSVEEKDDDGTVSDGSKAAGENVELLVEGYKSNNDTVTKHVNGKQGKSYSDEPLEESNNDVDAEIKVNDDEDAELYGYVMVG
ncbi:hypothetical protein ABFS82_14G212300 [Erythranthe guttata]